VNCVNCNSENVVTTNLNLIHFLNIQNRKNWVQNQASYVIFVKRCPNCPQNEILHITYQNGMKMRFSIFVTSNIKMGWIKSSYEDKYLKKFKTKIYIKKFMPEDQNNSCLTLYLFNHESECHEEKCATYGIYFWTYIKNVTPIK
jgi:hypothetical protein